MKTLLKSSLLILVLSFAVSPQAHAGGFGGWWWSPPPPPPPPPNRHDPPKTAPEVDPSTAFAGLSLLGGTLTVLRSRRRK